MADNGNGWLNLQIFHSSGFHRRLHLNRMIGLCGLRMQMYALLHKALNHVELLFDSTCRLHRHMLADLAVGKLLYVLWASFFMPQHAIRNNAQECHGYLMKHSCAK